MTQIIDTTATTIHTSAPQGGQGSTDPGSIWAKKTGGTLTMASDQWVSRPADEAVWTADEYLARSQAVRKGGATATTPWEDLKVEAQGEDLVLVGRTGTTASLTNWSMSQLAAAAGAPNGYMSKLPASIASQCLSHGLKNVEKANDAGLLFHRNEDRSLALRAVTTTRYERVWDAELAERIHRICETSGWGAAEPFRRAEGLESAHAWGDASQGLPLGWVGNRSSFIVLTDYETPIHYQGRVYSRFLIVENSEVGARKLRLTLGLVDFVCCNFMMWGCEEVHAAAFTHVGSIRDKVSAAFASVGRSRLDSGDVSAITAGMDRARDFMLGDTQEKVEAVTRKITGLPKGLVTDGYRRAIATPDYGSANSAWGMLNGLTEASQHSTSFADARMDSDLAASRLMTVALR